MDNKYIDKFKKIESGVWELSKNYRKKMNVPVKVIATEKLLLNLDSGAVEQAINVSQLPGIVGASWMMADAHWGYGFPVGGVAAFDLENGIISPGGIGFDINCGVRLLTTDLSEREVYPKIEKIMDKLFVAVPSGVGAGGIMSLSKKEFKDVMIEGAKWAVKSGFGWQDDIENIEDKGVIFSANPDTVSDRSVKRGIEQLGTLGSGNHYLEVQKVDTIFDPKVAIKFGIKNKGQVTIMIHCGSRGFGHQIGTDYLNNFESVMKKYGIKISDMQLACAPINSNAGKNYFAAMACAANYAFCNREIITHRVRDVFSDIFEKSARELGINLVYDVAHNIAKIETFKLSNQENKIKKLIVHRKGATRSYPNQPVIIGGSMESNSYLMVGTQEALAKTFGSTAHGSGRTMSRTKAKEIVKGEKLLKEMKDKGIYVKTESYSGLAEEAGIAYKDISEVVNAVSIAGISQPVASFKPIGNIKG